MNLGHFIKVSVLGGNEVQEWEGSVLSELGKGSERVLFQNVQNKRTILKGSETIFIVRKGLGFVMSNL